MLAVLRPSIRPLTSLTKPSLSTRSVSDASALADFLGGLSTNNDPPPTPGPDAYAPSTTPESRLRRPKLKAWKSVLNEEQNRPLYHLHCLSTRNNSKATFTKPDGSPIKVLSAGLCGFKGGNRSTYEAGYQCAVRIFKTIEEVHSSAIQDRKKKGLDTQSNGFDLEVILKGFGRGREAFKTALLSVEGEQVRKLVVALADRTPIKIGGTRAKKARR